MKPRLAYTLLYWLLLHRQLGSAELCQLKHERLSRGWQLVWATGSVSGVAPHAAHPVFLVRGPGCGGSGRFCLGSCAGCLVVHTPAFRGLVGRDPSPARVRPGSTFNLQLPTSKFQLPLQLLHSNSSNSSSSIATPTPQLQLQLQLHTPATTLQLQL